MATLSSIPKWQVLDGNGLPLAGAQLFTYLVGTDTPADTYTTYLGTTVAAWPLLFDAEGRSEVWLAPGLFKMVLKDVDDNIIWTVDGVSGGAGGPGSAVIIDTVIGATDSLVSLAAGSSAQVIALGYRTVGDGGGGSFRWDDNITSDDAGVYVKPTATIVTDPGRWVRVLDVNSDINVRWYGAYGDATHEDYTFFTKAITYCDYNNATLLIPSGTFSVNNDPGFSHEHPIKFAPNGILTWGYTGDDFDITPIIGDDDRTQHFDVGVYNPYFIEGTRALPHWFGAVGAGNDDTTKFQTTAASLFYGGELFIPGGSYVLTQDIVIQSKLKICGEGRISILKAGGVGVTWTGAVGLFSHDTTTTLLDNVEICNFTIDGTYMGYGSGTKLNAKNLYIHDMYFTAFTYNMLVLGGTYGGSVNVEFSHNYMYNAGYSSSTIALQILNGQNVRINDNQFIYDDDKAARNAIYLIPGTDQILEDITIEGNTIKNSNIAVQYADSQDKAVDGLIIRNNKITGAEATISIGDVPGASNSYGYAPIGEVIVDGNEVTMHHNGLGIDVHSGYYGSDLYKISNNSIYMPSPDAVTNSPITLANVTCPMIIESNCMFTDADRTNNAVYETNCTGIQYGINPTYNFDTPYVNAAPDSLLTIPGDTTFNRDVGVIGSILMTGRMQELSSETVASDSTVTLGVKGNVFHVSGASTIDALSNASWQDGASVKLIFDSSALVKHNLTPAEPAIPFILSGGSDALAGKDTVMSLTLDGDRWIETSRVVANSSVKGDTSAAYGQIDGVSQFSVDTLTSRIHYEADLASTPNMVTIFVEELNGTSKNFGQNKFESTNFPIPASIRPLTVPVVQPIIAWGTDNPATDADIVDAIVKIQTDGQIVFGSAEAANNLIGYNWTAWDTQTNTKGYYTFSVTYPIWR